MSQPPRELCCIGAGRVGAFSMLALAHRVPNVRITVVDEDADLINSWQGEVLPFYEPQLPELIQQYRGNKVNFTHDIENAIGIAEVIFLAIELKTKEHGLGEGGRLDYVKWDRMVWKIRNHAQGFKIVIDKSVVQFGKDNKICSMLENNSFGTEYMIFSNPDFFSRGTAFQNMLNPDRVVLGIKSRGAAIEHILPLYNWVDNDRIVVIDHYNGAEIGKFASNLYLGLTSILGNVIVSMCENIGVNSIDVMNVVRRDRRLQEICTPHGAIGGPSLQRDIRFAAYLCEESSNMKEQSQFLKMALKLNKKIKEDFVRKMSRKMISLMDKVVVVLGFAFKEETDDVSDSASLYICELMLKEKAYVRVVDPWVNEGVIRACFPPRYVNSGKLRVFNVNQLREAWNGADAICVPIRSDFFVPNIVPEDMVDMRRPRFFFDLSCNPRYNLAELENSGFRVYGFGRP